MSKIGQPISVLHSDVVSVVGSDQVALPNEAIDREGMFGHVDRQRPVGTVEIVVGAAVRDHGKLRFLCSMRCKVTPNVVSGAVKM